MNINIGAWTLSVLVIFFFAMFWLLCGVVGTYIILVCSAEEREPDAWIEKGDDRSVKSSCFLGFLTLFASIKAMCKLNK